MNKHYIRMEGKKAFLCCGKSGCPSVAKGDDGLIEITDDYGNTVKMKVEEADMIHLAVAHVIDDTPEEACEIKPEHFGIEPAAE